MVYSDTEIRAALKTGKIVCYPLIDENIRGSSIDLTLGEWFYNLDARPRNGFNPFDEDDVRRYFPKAQRAVPHGQWSADHKGLTWKNIPEDHPIIVMQPGERILAHTHEFVGATYLAGTTMMKARSTWGRNGIVVCKDAGWGDPGYINRWTMEIQNDNPELVVLPVGERIAQMIFFHTGPVSLDYGSTGKYQSGRSLAEIVASWTPEQMMPRTYRDERRLPDEATPEGAAEMMAAVEWHLAAETAKRQAELEAAGPAWK